MNPSENELHLSRISTLWTIVCRKDPNDAVKAAQTRMLERYGGAVRRYLLAATRDADAAEELFQEFAVRFCVVGCAEPVRNAVVFGIT